ncbi:MAG: hypothetical protein VKK97_09385 [Synechococcaceae cyanobacterium]|nr:hypothetical protein [Synechococcaceae cyanobacterium]
MTDPAASQAPLAGQGISEHGISEHAIADHALSAQGSSEQDPGWLRIWLAFLLSAAALSTVQISLWPRRPLAPPSLPPLPGAGQSLPSLPGHTAGVTAVSAIRRQRLPDGQELRLAAALSARGGMTFQVAGLTSPLPALKLHDRRLLRRPSGQIASGSLSGRPALQTCLIGSSQAVTAEALQALAARQQRPSGGRLPRLLGLQPQPDSRCLLVTLLAPASSSAGATSLSAAAQEQALLTRFEVVITRLRASR